MLSLSLSPSYIFPHLYSLSYLSIILLYLQYFGRLKLRSSGKSSPLSLVERVHSVALQALLCHKEPAQGS